MSREQNIKASIKQVLREYAEALAIAIFLALILRTFVLSAYKVPTSSMIPSLKVGDYIFAFKLPYGINNPFGQKKWGAKLPLRGDVVVFRCPQNPDQSCVKRVVGLPGDRVEIIKKRLRVNGELAEYKRLDPKIIRDVPGNEYYVALSESLSGHSRPILIGENHEKASFGPLIVPPNHFFVLGDNRDSSDDSRFWGSIPVESIEGRAAFIWMSLRWSSASQRESFPQVRWERLFKRLN